MATLKKDGAESKYLRIGIWNVRSIRCKEEEIVREMKKYRLGILGVSEAHLRGSGEKEVDGVEMVYSGVTEGRVKGGVAVLISEKLSVCAKEWRCVNERLMKVRLRLENGWLTVVQVYAPTEDSAEEMKTSFYDSLEELLASVSKSDQLVVMGDFNARVGRDVTTWDGVIGSYGEEVKNRNGQKLLGLCATNELVVLNTIYQHKDIHKYTWESKGRGLTSIIDYFIVKKAMRPGVADVKVIRGAELDSDHYLVLMKVSLKPRKLRKEMGVIRQKLRVNKLAESSTRRRFQVELSSRFRQRRCVDGNDVERVWREFKDSITEATEKVVGRSKKRKVKKATSWWSVEVKQAVRKKKDMYKKALGERSDKAWEEYKVAKKEAKRVVREAKEADWIRCGKQLQKNFLENRRAFWKKVKEKETTSRLRAGIEGKDGKLLTDIVEVKERWREHFSELLEGDGRGIGMALEEREIEEGLVDEITEDEIRGAIARLKRGKAAGVCGIQGEMVKAGGDTVVRWLHLIFNMVWKTGKAPEDWQKAVIVAIHKKGSKKLCKNYRGISLLSIPGKVFAKILDARMRQVTEGQVMEEQAGFRVGRGCRDQIFVMRQLAEKTIEKDGKMYAAFIDLEKAYDKVWREDMWRTLATYGVSGRLLRAVKALYENSKARVRVEDELTECFEVRQGVRQGCPLSPWLFNVFLDMVAREARAQFKGGVCLDNCTVQLLMFADDTVLLAETEEDLQHNVREFSEAVKRHRLAMNTEKTTTMVFSRKQVDCSVEVDGRKLENVRKQTYLGVILSEDGKMDCELEKRIGAALSAAGAVRSKVFESREMSRSAKMLVYKAMIEPTLTYGAESWVLKEREKQRIQAAEMRVFRKIAGVRRMDHMRNDDIRAQLRQEGIVEQVGRKREVWKKRVEEQIGSVTEMVMSGTVPGKRPRGRPRKRWSDAY